MLLSAFASTKLTRTVNVTNSIMSLQNEDAVPYGVNVLSPCRLEERNEVLGGQKVWTPSKLKWEST